MARTVTDNFGRELWLRVATKVDNTWFVDVLTDSTLLGQFTISKVFLDDRETYRIKSNWVGKGFSCCDYNFIELPEYHLENLFLDLVKEGAIPF